MRRPQTKTATRTIRMAAAAGAIAAMASACASAPATTPGSDSRVRSEMKVRSDQAWQAPLPLAAADSSTADTTTTSTTTTSTTTTTAAPPAPTPAPAPVGWNTYWTDEFNTTTIDTTRWKPYANNYGAGNNELQCNLPDNAATADGALTITGRKQTVTCPGSGTYNYTSAFLGSRDTGTYYPLYGRYEIRARVPHGQGLWPGFWLRHRTGSSNAEVDILEMFHNQAPGTATQTLHFPNSIGTNTAKKTTFFETPTPGTGDWHTFGVEIEPAGTNAVKFTFLIDNTPTHTYTNTNAGSWINTADPNATWDIAINMSVGGAWVGHPEEHLGYLPDKNLCGLTYRTPPAGPDSCPTTGLHLANLPATYQIDWVRVSTR